MSSSGSNRHRARPLSVLLNTTNYPSLALIRKRPYEQVAIPLGKAIHTRASILGEVDLLCIRQKHGKKRGWDLHITGASLALETLTYDRARTANLKIRSGHFLELNRTAKSCFSVTPVKSRTERSEAVLGKDGEDGIGERVRTVAVRSLLGRGSGKRPKSGSLIGSTVNYSVRKEPALPFRAQLQDRAYLRTPCKYRGAHTDTGSQTSRTADSPTKQMYQKALQRASEQIERENLRGWE